MIEIRWDADQKFLRQFAALFVLFFAIVGGLHYYNHGTLQVPAILWTIGTVIGVTGFIYTPFIRWVYLGWMIAIYPIAWTVSVVILAIVLYLVVTPIGLIMRMIGRDPLHREFDSEAATYWVPRRQVSDTSRYFRQF